MNPPHQPRPSVAARIKNLVLVILAGIAVTLLMAAMTAVRWTGDGCLWGVSRLGRLGSRLSGWTIALSEFGKRHC